MSELLRRHVRHHYDQRTGTFREYDEAEAAAFARQLTLRADSKMHVPMDSCRVPTYKPRPPEFTPRQLERFANSLKHPHTVE